MKDEYREIREELIRRSSHAEQLKQLLDSPNVVKTARKMMLSENGAVSKKGIVRVQDWCNAVRFIVEYILELTPAEYDSLYNAKFNASVSLSYTIKRIVEECPSWIRKECMFSQKKILLRMCWPEYYKEHYPPLSEWEILQADSDMRGDLKHAGNGQKTSFSHTKHVDEVNEILYNAINKTWPIMFGGTVRDMFTALANPKESGIHRLGAINIIMDRKEYPSPLDFYFLQSPAEFQARHLHEYLQVREASGLAPVKTLSIISNMYGLSYDADYYADRD